MPNEVLDAREKVRYSPRHPLLWAHTSANVPAGAPSWEIALDRLLDAADKASKVTERAR